MHIRVTSCEELLLENADDFGQFSIIIDEGAALVSEAALSRIARLEGGKYAWVRPEGLRSISPRAGDSDWESGLFGMMEFAAGKGWLDHEGAIRAHLENAEAKAVGTAPDRPAVNVQLFKDAMRNLAGGVAVVTTQAGGVPSGLTVTAVTSVSTEPPSLLVCLNRSSSSHDIILNGGRFGVNLLGAQHEQVAMRFAGMNGIKGPERFTGLDWKKGTTGSPLLKDALCSLDCEVLMHQAVGSHTIFIGRVVGTCHGVGEPLVNFRGKLTQVALS